MDSNHSLTYYRSPHVLSAVQISRGRDVCVCLVLTEQRETDSANAYFASDIETLLRRRRRGRRSTARDRKQLGSSGRSRKSVYDLTCKGNGNALNIKGSAAFYDRHETAVNKNSEMWEFWHFGRTLRESHVASGCVCQRLLKEWG